MANRPSPPRMVNQHQNNRESRTVTTTIDAQTRAARDVLLARCSRADLCIRSREDESALSVYAFVPDDEQENLHQLLTAALAEPLRGKATRLNVYVSSLPWWHCRIRTHKVRSI